MYPLRAVDPRGICELRSAKGEETHPLDDRFDTGPDKSVGPEQAPLVVRSAVLSARG